jgi:NADPH:quinone reductase-like Zn-dependent oxidoreductase
MPYGALAERTVVAKGAYAPIAEGIDPAVATVLATAITGMSIRTAAAFVPGETVLVQGATGEEVPLSDIETAWQRTDLRGRRLVVVP